MKKIEEALKTRRQQDIVWEGQCGKYLELGQSYSRIALLSSEHNQLKDVKVNLAAKVKEAETSTQTL